MLRGDLILVLESWFILKIIKELNVLHRRRGFKLIWPRGDLDLIQNSHFAKIFLNYSFAQSKFFTDTGVVA